MSNSNSNDAASQRKIFIGGLSYSTDDEKLRKYFGAYGAVQDAVVMKDPISRRSRGFGFITFCDLDSVDNALAHEPHTIDSRKVEAKRAVPRSDVPKEVTSTSPPTPAAPIVTAKYITASSVPVKSTTASIVAASNSISSNNPSYNLTASIISSKTSSFQSTQVVNTTNQAYMQQDSKFANDPRIISDEYAYHKVFVGGLHYDTRDAEFRSYFEKFGKVLTAEVMFNRETHKSRGFGFIVFELEKGAEAVCAEKEHIIDGKVVEVKRAIPRAKIPPGSTSPVVSSIAPPSNSIAPLATFTTTTTTTTLVRPAVANSKPVVSSVAKPISLFTTQTSVNNVAASSKTKPLGAPGIKSTLAFSYAAAVKGSETEDEFLLSPTDQFYEDQSISNDWEESSSGNLTFDAAVSRDSGSSISRLDGRGSSRSNSYDQSPSFNQSQSNAGFAESLLPPASNVNRAVNNAGIVGHSSSSTNAWGTQSTSSAQTQQGSLLTGINWLSAVGGSSDSSNASGLHDVKVNSFAHLHPDQVMNAPNNMMLPPHYNDMHHKYQQQQQQYVQQPMPSNAAMLGGRVVHMPANSQGLNGGVQNEWAAGYGPPNKDNYGIDQHQYYPPQQPHQLHMPYPQQDQRSRLYTPQPPYGHQPMPMYSNEPNQGYNMVSNQNIGVPLPSYRNVTLAQPPQVQAQPPNPLGLPVTSLDIRTDDLFAFKDLRLDAAEFDPNFAWNNRGNGSNNSNR